MQHFDQLPYDPSQLKRELTPFYISTSDSEIESMLEEINHKSFDELFSHLPPEILMKKKNVDYEALSYSELIQHVQTIANKNNLVPSFIGDGLLNFKTPNIVPQVCSVRGLTTAYTPYQPERSQGTLYSLWLYASCLSQLTGFEAINASLYDRSTALFEALNTAIRIQKGNSTVLICESLLPADREVLATLAFETNMTIITVPLDKETGTTAKKELDQLIEQHRPAALAFPQVNSLGLLEDVHLLADTCQEKKLVSIAVIDPVLIGKGGLLPPSEYGVQGADLFVGEAQHLALGPNFGGPGLGIFGIRYNDKNKNSIRHTAGRYVGKTKDVNGNDCLCMVLSTREQHIRREKATSNICSNQSFVATITGAAILAKGDEGMEQALVKARQAAEYVVPELTSLLGVQLAYTTPFFNEVTLQIEKPLPALIQEAQKANLQIGVDVSSRGHKSHLLKISFTDKQEKKDLEKLIHFFQSQFKKGGQAVSLSSITGLSRFERVTSPELPKIPEADLYQYYQKLGQLNVSPDDSIYPLGSCTMKYNPYINDYAASLPGFTEVHPQAPEKDAQGCLEILYEIQEMFKSITGLPGVTTQPVAGAQGELVGLKMFQAYFKDRGEKRDILLIPRSAHGTNPATATMAGYESKLVNGEKVGIFTIEANNQGQIDFEQLEALVKNYSNRIAGIMVTNPNTSGIFESQFKEMSDLIHSVGGLVYMDGANMNAIAGWVDLNKMGVDAVHNNLHKTWTIPHGGGGPGDAIVAVSEKLVDYMPGIQVKKENNFFSTYRPSRSIGSFHRHFGNFAHKVRCYTYLKALGDEGVKKMSAVAVLSAKYLYQKLKDTYPTLPAGAHEVPRMHEFILTLSEEGFASLQQAKVPKAKAIAQVGKLFLDFGMHAPTVAFPEVYGLMIEPTESFTKSELDHFIEILGCIHHIIHETPNVLTTAPHFTPVRKVDEVNANKNLCFYEKLTHLPKLPENPIDPKELNGMKVGDVCQKIIEASKK